MKKFTVLISFVFILFSCKKNISDAQFDNFIKYMGGGSGSYGYDVLELPSGGFVVTGYDNSQQYRKQLMVARTDKAGNVLWIKSFGEEHNEEGRVVKFFDDELFIAGNKSNYITGVTETFLMKISLSGDSLDFFTYSPNVNVIVNDMVINNDFIFIAGENFESNSSFANYFIASVDHSGEPLWTRSYGNSSGRQSCKKIFLKDNNNILMVGTNNSLIESNQEHVTITELNSLGISIGGVNLTTDYSQGFGNAVYHNNTLYVMYTKGQDQSVTSHLVSVTENNTIDLDINPGIEGKVTSMVMLSNNKVLYTSEISGMVTFSTLDFSDNGDDVKVNKMRQFPGEVKKMINTRDKGVLSVGTTSPDYGTMLRLIKTDEQLYLLNP